MITFRKTYILLSISVFLISISSCQPKAQSKENASSNSALQESKRLLMHSVYLNLKDSISVKDKQYALAQLKRLKNIKAVTSLYAGFKAETGDSRLHKDYDLVLHATFQSTAELKTYDQDSTHAEVRRNLKPLLARPPMVFDYWAE